jgi:hypothetical protein
MGRQVKWNVKSERTCSFGSIPLENGSSVLLPVRAVGRRSISLEDKSLITSRLLMACRSCLLWTLMNGSRGQAEGKDLATGHQGDVLEAMDHVSYGRCMDKRT